MALWLYLQGAPVSQFSEKKNPVDVVLFCGSPGAGKSSFFWRHLKPLGYERVNQDTLKTVRELAALLYHTLST